MKYIIFLIFSVFTTNAYSQINFGSTSATDSIFIKQIVFKNQVQVLDSNDLIGTLSSDKLYLIQGTVDMGANSIIVPRGGLAIRGLGFGVGKLITSVNDHELFISPSDSSGNLFLTELDIEVTGVNSKVFNLVDATGFNAIEMNVVNFNGCSSLGTINRYRQGLELNTGRFGGDPTLTLAGNWVGGYRATSTITFGASDTTIQYKAGNSLLLNGRFLTDINTTLSDGASFCDFTPSNIANTGDFQINNGNFNGLTDRTQYFPNFPETSIKSYFKNNRGLKNTYLGARMEISATATTPLTLDVFSQVEGTIITSDTVYFEALSSGFGAKYIGNIDGEFKIAGAIQIDGGANDEIEVVLRKFTPPSTFETFFSSTRTVSNLVGGLDLADFNINTSVELSFEDEIELWITNRTDNTDVIATAISYLLISEM